MSRPTASACTTCQVLFPLLHLSGGQSTNTPIGCVSPSHPAVIPVGCVQPGWTSARASLALIKGLVPRRPVGYIGEAGRRDAGHGMRPDGCPAVTWPGVRRQPSGQEELKRTPAPSVCPWRGCCGADFPFLPRESPLPFAKGKAVRFRWCLDKIKPLGGQLKSHHLKRTTVPEKRPVASFDRRKLSLKRVK